jgi:hypothetical protein
MATTIKINKKQLLKDYPYISKNRLAIELRDTNYKTERGLRNYLAKVNAAYEYKANKKDVLLLTISIEWKRNRTYGNYDPHASYFVEYHDGTTDRARGYSCNGGNYDKESTVVLNIFNTVLSGMLWRKRNSRKEKPYGVYCDKDSFPCFGWGIGMNSVDRIVKWFGGTIHHTACSDKYDQYEIIFRKPKAVSK